MVSPCSTVQRGKYISLQMRPSTSATRTSQIPKGSRLASQRPSTTVNGSLGRNTLCPVSGSSWRGTGREGQKARGGWGGPARGPRAARGGPSGVAGDGPPPQGRVARRKGGAPGG